MHPLATRCALYLSAVLSSHLFVSLLQADIYMYIDKNGNQHFSEQRVNNKYKLLLRSSTNQISPTFKNWKEESERNVNIPERNILQKKYHPIIVNAAKKYQLEAAFLHAVISAESSYRHRAISSAGAKGLMQLMPVTAKRFGVNDPFDPQQSIFAGALYLKKLLKEFKTKDLALAAYNAGEGTVRRYKKTIPPYPETQRYVVKVMDFYHHYKKTGL